MIEKKDEELKKAKMEIENLKKGLQRKKIN